MKTVIFDLDGTLADSKKMLSAVLFEVLKNGLPKGFSEKDLERYADKNPRQAVKELGINKLQLIYYIIKGRRLIKLRRSELKPIEGIEQVLKFLKANKVKMYVASSNSKLVVDSFLQGNHLDGYFSETWGRLGFFSKARGLSKIITKLKLSKSDLIYIGDEIKDIQSCKEIDLQCISVTWGLNSASSLKKINPDMVAESPKQLQQKLKKWLELQ